MFCFPVCVPILPLGIGQYSCFPWLNDWYGIPFKLVCIVAGAPYAGVYSFSEINSRSVRVYKAAEYAVY